jgi:hypothetical protein
MGKPKAPRKSTGKQEAPADVTPLRDVYGPGFGVNLLLFNIAVRFYNCGPYQVCVARAQGQRSYQEDTFAVYQGQKRCWFALLKM